MDNYYNPADLKKFGKIADFQPALAAKFFDYYNEVFKEGALTARYCTCRSMPLLHDAYTQCSLEKGDNEEQMMEAVHVACAIF